MQLLAVFLSAALAMAGAPPADTKIPTPPTDPSEADVERSHALYENGFKLYQEGSYDEAIVAFRSAYALSGEPTLLYNLALAAERAGDYDMALEYLQAYRVFAKNRLKLTGRCDTIR